MTTSTDSSPLSRPICLFACAALLAAQALATSRTPRAPRAASTPSTAQILAPSAATVPDALPPARQVWRCGDSYSTRPCDGARQVDVADGRSEAQRAQGEDVAARDKRLAAWLEAGRREREKGASAPTAGRAATRPEKACVATKRRACAPQPAASRRVAVLPKAGK